MQKELTKINDDQYGAASPLGTVETSHVERTACENRCNDDNCILPPSCDPMQRGAEGPVELGQGNKIVNQLLPP